MIFKGNIALMWPARLKLNVPLRCRVFGHRWVSGWYGGYPYFSISKGPVDNMDRHHMKISVECDNCGEVCHIGSIHQSSIDKERREV